MNCATTNGFFVYVMPNHSEMVLYQINGISRLRIKSAYLRGGPLALQIGLIGYNSAQI